MKKFIKIKALIATLVLLPGLNAVAQTTSSPYSVFGLGYLEGNSLGPLKAMGGTGIAFPSDRSVNLLNPASYSGIDSLISIFELGLFGKYTNFRSNTENQSLVNANMKYVVMGFRITPWLSTSFGFAPYSSIGYNINTTEFIEGSNQLYPKKFEGEGGVNQVFLGAAVKLIPNLSLGVNASYLFGNITHTESSQIYYYSLQDVTYLSNITFNYGLNYRFSLKNTYYSLGLIYSSPKTLNAEFETTVKTSYNSATFKGRAGDYRIPRHFGAGIAVQREFFRAGADFERSLWKNVDFANPILRTRNSNRYSFGVEIPSLGARRGTGGMIFYRLGAEFRESYMVIDNQPINYKAISFGAGLPLKGFLSIINVSLELGQEGTLKSGLFRENFCTLHLDMSLRNLWFRKKLYQ